MKTLRGIYTVAPTPFDAREQVDVDGIGRLCAFLGRCGVDGVTVLGVMGEAHKLLDRERGLVVRSFRAALPVGMGLVVGVRAAGTDLAVAAARDACIDGADALLVGPPPVQDDDVIVTYFQRIASETDVPLIVHDYPEATGIVLSPQLIARLHREVPSVRCIKLEDPPTGPKIERVRQLTNRQIAVFGALGGMFFLEELDRGAVGMMTGFACPELLVEVLRRHRDGDRAGAEAVFHDALPLIRFEFQRGLAAALRKELLVMRGVLVSAQTRHPGAALDRTTIEQLHRLLHVLHAKGYDLDAAQPNGTARAAG